MQKNSKLEYPWLFFGSGTKRDCWSYRLIFEVDGIIPARCRHFCWKVVITLGSYQDLLSLKSFLYSYKYLSKCGFDRRGYTDALYAGFIYCDTMAQAEDVKKDVLAQVDFAQDVKVCRGCTEMRAAIDVETWDDIPPKDIGFDDGYRVFQSAKRRLEVMKNWEKWEGELCCSK